MSKNTDNLIKAIVETMTSLKKKEDELQDLRNKTSSYAYLATLGAIEYFQKIGKLTVQTRSDFEEALNAKKAGVASIVDDKGNKKKTGTYKRIQLIFNNKKIFNAFKGCDTSEKVSENAKNSTY